MTDDSRNDQGPDPEPDVTKAPTISMIDELWRRKHLTFGEYQQMIREAKSRPPETEEGQPNTVAEIHNATYIKVPVGLLVLLHNALMNDTPLIQDKYANTVLDLLQKGELS